MFLNSKLTLEAHSCQPSAVSISTDRCQLMADSSLRQLLDTLLCLWSEKTTVCRIFNCQRALKLSAASLSSRLFEGRSRGQLLSTRSERRERVSALDQPSNLTIRRAMFQARPDIFNSVRLRHFVGPGSVRSLPSRNRRMRQLSAAKAGGEYRARTGDLLVANQALSQLS